MFKSYKHDNILTYSFLMRISDDYLNKVYFFQKEISLMIIKMFL